MKAAAAQLDVSPTHMRSRQAKSANHALLPGEASTALSVVTFLFASDGVISLVFIAVGLGGKLAGWSLMADVPINPLVVLLRVGIAAGYLWTAWLLAKRRELGGVLGLAFLGLSIVPRLLAGGRLIGGNLLIPVLEAVALALAWSYLDDEVPERDGAMKTRSRAV